MHQALKQLLSEGTVITDGAWGTQLQLRGLGLGESPDVWNVEQPGRVMEVASAYVESGSRIILTNTFGANRVRLREYGRYQVSELNRRGVEISLAAAAGRAKVFGSIGPSGKLLLDGEITKEELRSAFSEQTQAMAEAGAEGLVIETMSDIDEATIAVAAARETSLPVIACMVFDSGKAKDRTMMGQTPEQAAEALSEAGADVIGANCGQGVAGFVAICQRLRAATDRPIWIKANAGLPTLVDGKAEYHVTPEEFASYIPQLVAAGAAFLGGCCGTTPEFISALAGRGGRPYPGRAARKT
jgi:5-methyltetrahydrofolate--homocysteine methyltransferase